MTLVLFPLFCLGLMFAYFLTGLDALGYHQVHGVAVFRAIACCAADSVRGRVADD